MTEKASCTWQDIQKLALDNSAASDKDIKDNVLEAQRLSVKLPVVRKAAANVVINDENGVELFSLEKGQTVVCDIVRHILTFTLKPFRWKPASHVAIYIFRVAIHMCLLS